MNTNTPPDPRAPQPPSSVDSPITQCLAYLQSPSDTSRFVGLTVLSTILKNQNIAQDHNIVRKLWDSMPYKFLDRLLISRHSSNTPPDQSKDMVELAVNVIHAFSLLLPLEPSTGTLVSRAPRIIAALVDRSASIAIMHGGRWNLTILETLSVFAASETGAEAILGSNLEPLLGIAPRYNQGIQVLLYTLTNGLRSETGITSVTKGLLDILGRYSATLSSSGGEDRLRVLSFFSDLLPRLPLQILPSSTSWVTATYTAIRHMITTTHSPTERTCATIICASLLSNYPPSLLFQPQCPPSVPQATCKLFTFLFIRLLSIDIRASIPSLMELLCSSSYPAISQHLACAYDILTAFLEYLVQLDSTFERIGLDPEHLLKLRGDMGEALSLTVEFLRDRWDAKFAGAAGYQMITPGDDVVELRIQPCDGTPLNIAWDAVDIEGGLVRDPLIISAVRALSLWLREDDTLRKEAGGLMDVFLGLWKQSSEHQVNSSMPEKTVDYRLWLVSAIAGTLTEKNGREMFKIHGGWDVVWLDIQNVYRSTPPTRLPTLLDSSPETEPQKLATEELRVLVDWVLVSDYMDIPHCETKFLEVSRIARITRFQRDTLGGSSKTWLMLDVGVLRLAASLLKKVPGGSYIHRGSEAEKVKALIRELCGVVHQVGLGGEDVVMELSEIMDELGFI